VALNTIKQTNKDTQNIKTSTVYFCQNKI